MPLRCAERRLCRGRAGGARVARTDPLAVLACVLLLACAAALSRPVVGMGISDFTAQQQSNTHGFLQSFVAAGWPLQSAWTGTDFCSWNYVSCDSSGVTLVMIGLSLTTPATLPELGADVDGAQVALDRIQIFGFQSFLNGTLPVSWGQLTRLGTANLNYNSLTGTLPAEWESLTNLQTLWLAGNQLSGTLPAEWGSLNGLEELHLQVNQLSGTLPGEWGSLNGLEKLDLDSNQLSGTLPAEWGSLNGLEELDLQVNQLSGTLPAEWGSLSGLQELHLQVNQLSGTYPAEWGSLSELRQLSLFSNKLSGALPAAVNYPYLSLVDITNNSFCGCVPSAWIGPLDPLFDADPALTAANCSTANACSNEITTEPYCGVRNCLQCSDSSRIKCIVCDTNYTLTGLSMCHVKNSGSGTPPAAVAVVMACVLAAVGVVAV